MQMSVKVLTGVGVIAAVVIIGVAVGWFGAGTTKQPNPSNSGSQSSINPPPNRTSSSENPNRAQTTKGTGPAQPSAGQQNASQPVKHNPQVATPPPGGYITNWDDRLET